MTDSVALQRNSEGRVVFTQRRKIIKALSRSDVSNTNKVRLVKWLPGQATVTAGSTIETALLDVNTALSLW